MIRLLPSSLHTTLFKDTGWAGASQLGRAAASVLTIAILTQRLGVSGFGQYAGTAGLVSIFIGLSDLGASDQLLIQHTHNDFSILKAWSHALGTTALGLVIALFGLIAVGVLVLPAIPVVAIACLGLAEFVASAVILVNNRCLEAIGDFRRSAQLGLFASWSRTGLAVPFLFIQPTLTRVAIAFLIAAMAALLVSTVTTIRRVGQPRPVAPSSLSTLRTGGTIAVGQTSLSIAAGVDQTLLLSYGMDSAAGIYGLGVRVVGYCLIPVWALMTATYPSFFRRGAIGPDESMKLAKRLAPPLAGFAVLVGVGLVAFAVPIEKLVGAEFKGIARVIVVLSGFPLIKIGQSILADVLAGSGKFGFRSLAVMAAAGLNIGLNILLIPSHGWQGAAAATYVSELLYLGLLAAAVRHLLRDSRVVAT